jgi:hypothetical protein
MVFQYISWQELEPTEGEYRFEDWEKTWDVEAARGKHIIFRVYIDYPSLPSGLPNWLREAGVKEVPYKDHGGGLSPDYNDPRMIAAMEKLIAALGERYNKHPRIAFIQLGLLGFWGEWHTWPQDKLYASPETERRIIAAYHRAFPDKVLMARYASRYAGEQQWLGFHDDMFPEDTDNGEEWSFLAGIRQAKRIDNWRVAVIGGEMVPNKAKDWLGKGFETTMEMTERSHFTWVGPYCPALERNGSRQFKERSQALVRKLGYQFQLNEVSHPSQGKSGQPFPIKLKLSNTGVAPFYYPWLVQWALFDKAGEIVSIADTDWDVRDWLPGESVEVADIIGDAPAGTYRLGLGIRDPWQDRPAIRFANDLPTSDGWTIVSEIQIR